MYIINRQLPVWCKMVAEGNFTELLSSGIWQGKPRNIKAYIS